MKTFAVKCNFCEARGIFMTQYYFTFLLRGLWNHATCQLASIPMCVFVILFRYFKKCMYVYPYFSEPFCIICNILPECKCIHDWGNYIVVHPIIRFFAIL